MAPREFTVSKPPTRGRQRDLTALDAAVLARLGSWAITSPNTNWVPALFFGKQRIQMRADGRFGYNDPWQWPQPFSEEYPWSVAILSKTYHASPSPISWAWYMPRYADFVLQKDSSKGNLNRATLNGLKGLLEILQSRFNSYRRAHMSPQDIAHVQRVRETVKKMSHLLEFSVLTWRDMVVYVANYQRAFLETYAIMDYCQLIIPRLFDPTGKVKSDLPTEAFRWMGGVTSSPLWAERLYGAGVPVWLLRDENDVPTNITIESIVAVREPSDIIIHNYMDPVGQFAWPFDIEYEYEGHAGSKEMHAKLRAVTYRAKELVSTTSQNSGNVHRTLREGAAGWQPYNKDVPAAPPLRRDLWDIVQNDFLPSPLSVVESAFYRVKSKLKDKAYKTKVTVPSPLRFPDPVMMAVVQSPDTMQRYFANWLAIRTTWIQRITASPSADTLSSKEWRAFLLSTPADLSNGKATASAKERVLVLKRLRDVLPDEATGMSWAGDDVITFRNHDVKVCKSVLPVQARAVTWELCELHFQHDVLAMDRALVPKKWQESPAEREALWREVCPQNMLGESWNASLLAANVGLMRVDDRYNILNAFARLLSDWPDAPQHFTHPITPELGVVIIRDAMTELMTFYVKTFYQRNGRPPVCPRPLPVF